MNICVVLVTYNRKEELVKTLEAYERQAYLPHTILVVDNHSTDGTGDMLRSWQSADGATVRRVLSLPENVGGSGGFYEGMRMALELGSEWIYVSDDDAVPDREALSAMAEYVDSHADEMDGIAALCGVIRSGDDYAYDDRCVIAKWKLGGKTIKSAPKVNYMLRSFDIDCLSYVGSCIKADAIRQVGLPLKEFFIYFDDFEHSLRLRRAGRIVCLTDSVMYHKCNSTYSREANWRDYYATRNVLYAYLKYFGKLSYYRRAWMRRLTAIRSLNRRKYSVIRQGIKDAKAGRLGIHPIYRPGWKPGDKRASR